MLQESLSSGPASPAAPEVGRPEDCGVDPPQAPNTLHQFPLHPRADPEVEGPPGHPALLPPVRLQFHGSEQDTPRLADKVANQGTMEEDKGEGLVGAEHAEGGQAAEEKMAEGGLEPELN